MISSCRRAHNWRMDGSQQKPAMRGAGKRPCGASTYSAALSPPATSACIDTKQASLSCYASMRPMPSGCSSSSCLPAQPHMQMLRGKLKSGQLSLHPRNASVCLRRSTARSCEATHLRGRGGGGGDHALRGGLAAAAPGGRLGRRDDGRRRRLGPPHAQRPLLHGVCTQVTGQRCKRTRSRLGSIEELMVLTGEICPGVGQVPCTLPVTLAPLCTISGDDLSIK